MKSELFIKMILLVLFACQSGSHQKDHDLSSEKENHSSPEENTLKDHLTLNNGQKWITDESTRKNVEEMQEIVEALEKEGIHTVDEYNEAGKKIQNSADKLIQGCRMSGKEHEMLHEWLLPLLSDIKTLTTSGEMANAQKAFLQIDQRLHRFNLFFE